MGSVSLRCVPKTPEAGGGTHGSFATGFATSWIFFTFQPSFFEIHSQTYILFVKEQTSDCNSLNSDDLGARNSTFVDSVPFCAFISEHGPFPEAVPWNLQMVFRPGFTILLRIPLTVSHPLFLTSESHQGQGSPVATARKGR